MNYNSYGITQTLSAALVLLVCGLSLLACPSGSRAASPLPQGFGAGQIEKQIEGMPSPKAAPQAAPLPNAAKTRVTMGEKSFVLTGVLVEGATAFRSVEFLPLYQSYLGRKITVDDLRNIAESFTRYYHQAGYFLSHAFLPAQHIEFGVVRIRMIEGYISNWRMLDDAKVRDPLLDKILQPIMERRPLRRDVLNEAFQNLAALPDLDLHPYVRPLANPLGAYELVLRSEQKHFEGGVSIDNHGSDYIGPVQAVAALRAFNLTGHHETYQLKLATTSDTDELHYADLGTEWLLGASGLRLQVGGAITSADPGGLLKPLDAHIENSRFQLGVSYPLQRTVHESTRLSIAVNVYRSRTDLFGVKRLEDRLTSVILRYRRVSQPEKAVTHAAGISFSRGFKIAGSEVVDTQSSTGVGRPDFAKLSFNYTYHRIIRHHWELTAQLDGQYAATSLPGSERYSVGGAQFGRAYDPSEITGDHGLAGRLEIAYRRTGTALHWHCIPFGFYDLGAVWQVHPRSSADRASLASLGLGFRLIRKGLSAYVEAGKPLTRPVASQGDDGDQPRVFAGMAYQF